MGDSTGMSTQLKDVVWTEHNQLNSPFWDKEKKLALTAFQALGFPNTKQELWKYFDIQSFLQTEVTSSQTVSAKAPKFTATGTHVVFNGQSFESIQSSPSVTAKAFSQLTTKELDTFKRIQTFESHQKNPFALLNDSQFGDGLYVSIAGQDQESSAVIELTGEYTGLTHPKVAINVEANSKGHVVVLLSNDTPQHVFSNMVLSVNINTGAELDLTVLQLDQSAASRLTSIGIQMADDAQLNTTFITHGTTQSRLELTTEFMGENTHVSLNGLAVLDKQNQSFIHTRANHNVPNTTCQQLFKNVVTDHAVSEFNGLVYVAPKAQKTDSSQHNKNLLLSDSARSLARPQLRINADDVSCAHGADIGQLDDGSLFYLESRGLSKSQAKALILKGFIYEILGKIAYKPARDYVDNYFKSMLPAFISSIVSHGTR